jgi:hypothetical protein
VGWKRRSAGGGVAALAVAGMAMTVPVSPATAAFSGDVPGYVTSAGASSMLNSASQDLVVSNTTYGNGRLYYRIGKTGGSWGTEGWREVPGNLKDTGFKPTVAAGLRGQYVAARAGTGLGMVAQKMTYGGTWDNSWTHLGGDFTSEGTVVADRTTGRVMFFGRGLDGYIWVRTYNEHTSVWGNWVRDNGLKTPFGIGIAAAITPMGAGKKPDIRLVSVNENKAVVHRHLDSPTWRVLPGGMQTDFMPTAAASGHGIMHVIVQKQDRLHYSTMLVAADYWRDDWPELPGGGRFQTPVHPTGGPTASTHTDPSATHGQHVVVYGIAKDGALWSARYQLNEHEWFPITLYAAGNWQIVPGTFYLAPPIGTPPPPPPPPGPVTPPAPTHQYFLYCLRWKAEGVPERFDNINVWASNWNTAATTLAGYATNTLKATAFEYLGNTCDSAYGVTDPDWGWLGGPNA